MHTELILQVLSWQVEIVSIKCDDNGNIDLKDLEKHAIMNTFELSCVTITYPSTHGVFESTIKDICRIVHENGGQVYLDGANLNAQVGLAKPYNYGADVSPNLHKHFAYHMVVDFRSFSIVLPNI